MIDCSYTVRLGSEQDLSNRQLTQAIARWYRKLHEKGAAYLADYPDELYDETNVITLSNLDMVAERTNTKNNPLWPVIHKYFGEIRRLIDILPPTLTYNDFYWTNLVVAKDEASVMMLDFNLLGKGYTYGDIRNVTSSLSEEAREAFLQEYGMERARVNEQMADAVLSPLVTLYFACIREQFPAWAKGSLTEVESGALIENLKRWLQIQ